MSTSDIDNGRAVRTAFIYTLISLFCALFGAVYERFGHEVYSYFMIYAFAIPLVFGAAVYLVIAISHMLGYPTTLSRNLYHSGVATLTVGSIVKGVFEIYGTTDGYAVIYWPVGFALLLSGILTWRVKKGKKTDE